MGWFKDMRNLRKQVKEMQQQAAASGVDTSLGGMLARTPDMLAGATQAIQQAQQGKAEGDRLRAQGLPGRARLLAVHDTGMTLGGSALGAAGQENPVAQLHLEVSVGGRPPYQATVTQMVPRLAVARLVPGSELPVKVDPLDPTNVLVDWDAPLANDPAPPPAGPPNPPTSPPSLLPFV